MARRIWRRLVIELVWLELHIHERQIQRGRHHRDLPAGASMAIRRTVRVVRRPVLVSLRLRERLRGRMLAPEGNTERLEYVAAGEHAEDEHHR